MRIHYACGHIQCCVNITTLCYNCDSFKEGVAQYMKTKWRVVAIFNVVLFVVLVRNSSPSSLEQIKLSFSH
ncbi:Tetraspanin-10 [Camellia lanceoleosa]|uniref:Tetraspanin-10 n=1 Tax=Camellia lanceoleosa TaxID=1840588 RepID=A0ACC0HBF9_9ERIC|nr:Tetraspanin-10 [Camellia lanceoleosa]